MTAKSSGVAGGSMCGGEGNMIHSPAGFDGWSDFPKGLRVLLLEHDDESAAQTRLELEQMDYIVSSFSSESEALEAVSSRPESFHVAVVEVNSIDHQESFRFLETARGLPTIMFCEGDCLSTMMQCIALGAAEILRKPLSDEKLRNIWQHVLHKALSAGENSLCRSLKPIRETATMTFQLQQEKQDSLDGDAGPESREADEGGGQEQSLYDGLPFPSTPQLEQVLRHLDSADSLDPSIYSAADHDCEITAAELAFSSSFLESVDITCDDMNCDDIENTVNPSKDSAICTETNTDETIMESSEGNPPEAEPAEPREHEPGHCRGKNSKKKLKVDWTPDLHRRFVQAVEQLGIEQAIPSKILSLMKVEGLTRHNIASHLQKYRMQRKHALPREEDRRWLHRRDSTSRVYAQKPLIALPPLRSNLAYPAMYPGWSHSSFHHPPRAQMWGHHAGFYPWNSNQAIWPWKSHTRMQADAWGCPVYSPQDHYPPPQIVSLNHIVLNQNRRSGNPGEAHLREEVIDEVVKEAISKPWLPLPIGLKPPSTDSVLAELQRQGIRSIPPTPRQCSLL